MADNKINNNKQEEIPSIPEISKSATNKIEISEAGREIYTLDSDKLIEGEQILAETLKENNGVADLSVISTGNIAAQKRVKEIEMVLADNLDSLYLSLAPDEQQKLKMSGEETARKINRLLDDYKIKIKQIIELIKKWLGQISGLNNFFLEQESKIKADKILHLKNN
jgi:S-adenosylmethionine hydrolase